jgi:hypothetical protein
MPLRLFVEAGNPYDFDRGELEELAASLSTAHADLAVEVSIREEPGFGVTLAEVVRIYIDVGDAATATAALGAVLHTAVEWARARWKRDNETHSDRTPRPRYVSLLGPDGQELRCVRVDSPAGDPQDELPQEHRQLPWPPKRT